MPPKEAGAAAPEVCSVIVAVRVRPFNKREKEAKSKTAVDFPSGPQSVRISPMARDASGASIVDINRGRVFAFDHCYRASVTQRQVFLDLGLPVLQAAFRGMNSCLFAYGQSGSGKSFAMLGPADAAHVLQQAEDADGEEKSQQQQDDGGETGLVALRGVIPRLAERLFIEMEKAAAEHEKTRTAKDGPLVFEANVTYLEIYQEKIHCLLDPKKANLKARQHPTQGVFVEDLTSRRVKSFQEVMHAIASGNEARQVASTNLNDRSSRSHAVFSIILRQSWTTKGEGNAEGETTESVSERRSQINLVDLAGSERAKSTGAEGETLKEGALINKSLTTLGLVISGLADLAKGTAPGGKQPHIPYRDSSLTFLLKENLGGNSKTFMLAACSPADINYEETLSTLRYADRAKAIVTKAVINEDSKDKKIRELKAEVEKYQAELAELQQLRELVAQQQLNASSLQKSATAAASAGVAGAKDGGDDSANNNDSSNANSSNGMAKEEDSGDAAATSEKKESTQAATAAAVAARERLEIAESLMRKLELEGQQAGSISFFDISSPHTSIMSSKAATSSSPTLVTSTDTPYLMNVEGAGDWAIMPLRVGATFFGSSEFLEELVNSGDGVSTADEERIKQACPPEMPRFFVKLSHVGVAPVHCFLTLAAPAEDDASAGGGIARAILRPLNLPDPNKEEEREHQKQMRMAQGAAEEEGEDEEKQEDDEAWTFIDADQTVDFDTLLRSGQTFQLGSEFVSMKYVDPIFEREEKRKKQEKAAAGGGEQLLTSRLRNAAKSVVGPTPRLNFSPVAAAGTSSSLTPAASALTSGGVTPSGATPQNRTPRGTVGATIDLPLPPRRENSRNNNNNKNNTSYVDPSGQPQQDGSPDAEQPNAASAVGAGVGGIAIPKLSFGQPRRSLGMNAVPKISAQTAAAAAAADETAGAGAGSSDDDDDSSGLPTPTNGADSQQQQPPRGRASTMKGGNNHLDDSSVIISSNQQQQQQQQPSSPPQPHFQVKVPFIKPIGGAGQGGDARSPAARGPLAMTPRSQMPPKIKGGTDDSSPSSPLAGKPEVPTRRIADEVVCMFKHTFVLLGDIGSGKTAFRSVLGKDFGFFEGLRNKVAPETKPTMGFAVSEMPQVGGAANKADLTFLELSGRLQTMFAPLQVMIPERRVSFMLFFRLIDRIDVQYYKPYIEIMQRASPHVSTNLILVGTHRDEVVLSRGNGRESLATDDEIRQLMSEIQTEFVDYARAFEPDEMRRPRVCARYALSLKERTALCTVVNPPVVRPDGTTIESVVVEQTAKKMSELLNSMVELAVKTCRADPVFSQGLIPTRVQRLAAEIGKERGKGERALLDATEYKQLAQRVDVRYVDRGSVDDLHRHTVLLHSWLALFHHHRHAILKRLVILDPQAVFQVVVVYCLSMACARTMCFYRPPAVPPPAGSVKAAAETLLTHFGGMQGMPFSIPIVRSRDGLITNTDDDPFRGEGISLFLTLAGGIVSMPVAKELFQRVSREHNLPVSACLSILCRFDLLLPADKVAVFMPNPTGVNCENGLLGSLVSLQQAAEEQRGVDIHSCGEEVLNSMKFYAAPLMFSRPASEALTMYVPSLLRWSGARTSRFSLNNVPYNLMGRLVCRLAHIADGVYVGPLPACARGSHAHANDKFGGGAADDNTNNNDGTAAAASAAPAKAPILPSDQRPFWNDAMWLISGYNARVLIRLVSRSLFIFFFDQETSVTCRKNERLPDGPEVEPEECLPAAWMMSEAAQIGINGGASRFISEEQRDDFASYVADRCDALWEMPSAVQEDVLGAVRSVLHETPGVVFREYEQQRVEDEGMTDLSRAPMTARGSSGWVLKGQEGCGTARGPAPAGMTEVSSNSAAAAASASASATKSGPSAAAQAAGAAAAAGGGATTAYDSSGEQTELDGTCSTRFSLDAERVQRMLCAAVMLHDEEELQLSLSLKIASIARNRMRLLEELWFLRHYSAEAQDGDMSPPSALWYDQWDELARQALSDECAAMDAMVDVLSAVHS